MLSLVEPESQVSKVARCRAKERECRRRAKLAVNQRIKCLYTNLAHEWRALAEQAEGRL